MDEEKDKKEEQQEPEEKPKKQSQEEIEKEMQQMLEDLSEQMGVDKSQIRVVSVKSPKRNFKTILFETIYYLVAETLLFLALSGYIDWYYGSWYDLIHFAMLLAAMELVLRNLTFILFKKAVIQTMGIILILPAMITMFVGYFLTFTIVVKRILSYIGVIIIVFIIREFIKKYFIDLYNRHKYKPLKQTKK